MFIFKVQNFEYVHKMMQMSNKMTRKRRRENAIAFAALERQNFGAL